MTDIASLAARVSALELELERVKDRARAPDDEVVREGELHKHWPVMGRSTWRKMIRCGLLASHKIPGVRARLVRVEDVLALLHDGREAGRGADRLTALLGRVRHG